MELSDEHIQQLGDALCYSQRAKASTVDRMRELERQIAVKDAALAKAWAVMTDSYDLLQLEQAVEAVTDALDCGKGGK